LAVLDVIEEEGLLERAVEIGNIIRDCIEGLALSNDTVNIAGLRGPGAMIAFDILDDEGKPNAVGAKAVCARALEQGLVLLSCGQHGQAIRILVPLTVSNDTLDTGLKILAKSLSLSSATGPEAA
jgi:4-aminobutyrate aminotransferase/(S)-3-amino-2-methylpropionate transaminase